MHYDNETEADIRAWLVNGEVARSLAAITDTGAMHDMLTAVADRIEVATARELSKNRPNNGSKIGQFGNAAALREALFDIVLLTVKAGKSLPSDVACGIIASKAKRALAAPARNCDKYSLDDIKKMDRDFGAFCKQFGPKNGENCSGCPIKPMDNLCCHSTWMLLPAAEGGDHAE